MEVERWLHSIRAEEPDAAFGRSASTVHQHRLGLITASHGELREGQRFGRSGLVEIDDWQSRVDRLEIGVARLSQSNRRVSGRAFKSKRSTKRHRNIVKD